MCPKTKCLTELFLIYQNKHWITRQQEDLSYDPLYYIEDCRILRKMQFYTTGKAMH